MKVNSIDKINKVGKAGHGEPLTSSRDVRIKRHYG